MKKRTFWGVLCTAVVAVVFYLIFFLFFSERLQTTEDTVRKLVVGAAISEFGADEYNITSPVHSFQEERKYIEEDLSLVRMYQRKYYYRALVESDALKFPIIYTIDGMNGNLISRGYGNEVIYY